MNPLTLVKRTQKITSKEAELGISDEASWHTKYSGSAYVFAGGLSYDLTEGDLLAVFSQYGEIVDVNLVRDKATGKPKGFAFIAYEDQRSTVLAVDNLNGAKVSGRIVRVDHVSKYKKKEEEEEEDEEKKEARGVCYAFQKGECNRGASCKFSHNEPKGGDPRWGRKEGDSRWENDKYDNEPPRRNRKNFSSNRPPRSEREKGIDTRRDEYDDRRESENKRKREDERESGERPRRDERESDERPRRDERGSSSRYYDRGDYRSSRR